MTDSDRVASDAEIGQFVLDRGLCLEDCPNRVTVIVVDRGDFMSLCEEHFRNTQANYPSRDQLRVRPAPRKIATPDEACELLRSAGIVAIAANPRRGFGGLFTQRTPTPLASKLLASSGWLVDPEETQT